MGISKKDLEIKYKEGIEEGRRQYRAELLALLGAVSKDSIKEIAIPLFDNLDNCLKNGPPKINSGN